MSRNPDISVSDTSRVNSPRIAESRRSHTSLAENDALSKHSANFFQRLPIGKLR